jgi:hypothetical protein
LVETIGEFLPAFTKGDPPGGQPSMQPGTTPWNARNRALFRRLASWGRL